MPLSNAVKASVMRRSRLLGASCGLLCRQRSEQYFTGVEAAFVVCDFRVPWVSDVSRCNVRAMVRMRGITEGCFALKA